MSYENIIKGNVTHANATSYFTQLGFNVLLPMFDHLPYDLVLEQDGIFYTVQCKYTSTETKNHYVVKLHGLDPRIAYSGIDLFYIETPSKKLLVTHSCCEMTKSRIKISKSTKGL